MRKVRAFLFAIVAVVGVSVIGVNAQGMASGSAQSSRTIAQKAYSKLRGLPRYGVFDNITVDVRGNTVILGGKVITLGTKSAAARAVRDIPGVTEVVNNISELPPSPFDDRIRREAYRSFISRGPGQYFSELNPDVRIIVENGRITLEGYVYRESDSNLLNILANGVNGTFKVTNNLIVGKRIA
jgi:BON domain